MGYAEALVALYRKESTETFVRCEDSRCRCRGGAGCKESAGGVDLTKRQAYRAVRRLGWKHSDHGWKCPCCPIMEEAKE